MGLFNRHKHDWELLRVEYGERFNQISGARIPQGPITWGYRRCKTCHKTLIDERQGHWAAEEIS
jgi:hypothetical protein